MQRQGVDTVGLVGEPAEELVGRLRRLGVRMTAPRRAVVEALVSAGSHVTAEELHAMVTEQHPDISPSSIYRTMDLLAEHGIVRHVHLGHGPAHFHLAVEEHGHLACDACGQIVELQPTLSRPFVRAVERALGFELDLRHFALTGRCAACRRTEPES